MRLEEWRTWIAEVVAVGVAAELFPKLRKNMFTEMNQNHAEHLGFEVRIMGRVPFKRSFMLPVVSTPANPAPATTNVRSGARAATDNQLF